MAEKYGIKVAQEGFSADSAADYQLLFTSEWPLLKIEKQGSITIADKTQDVTIATHDLGYAPMFLVYAASGVNADGTQARLLTGPPILVNDSELKWFGNYYSQAAGSITLYYYIFRYPLTQNFTSDIISQSASSPDSGGDQGLKMVQLGKDTRSADLRDYVVHTNARNLQLHKTISKSETGIGWSDTLIHGLDYEPFFLFYFKDIYGYGSEVTLNYWQLLGAGDQEIKGYADVDYIRLTAIPEGDIFVAIFKDPFALTE
jgi:hypothetical protein